MLSPYRQCGLFLVDFKNRFVAINYKPAAKVTIVMGKWKFECIGEAIQKSSTTIMQIRTIKFNEMNILLKEVFILLHTYKPK